MNKRNDHCLKVYSTLYVYNSIGHYHVLQYYLKTKFIILIILLLTL